MVDNFTNVLQLSKKGAAAETLVMEAAQDSQRKIEENHNECDLDNFYGETTFLGGMIFKANNGKRYFAGVNCGDCKLYRLSQGELTEVTKPARTETTNSGGKFGPNRAPKDKTEYTFSIQVQPGDRLFFMTDGVHDNLDRDPPEKETNEALGAADYRKLSTLKELLQDEQLGRRIMEFAHQHSEKYLNAMAGGQNMKTASRKEFPGKPDHMTLLVIQVR
jgi:serine/threonine protein phosphatase PrpC